MDKSKYNASSAVWWPSGGHLVAKIGTDARENLRRETVEKKLRTKLRKSREKLKKNIARGTTDPGY